MSQKYPYSPARNLSKIESSLARILACREERAKKSERESLPEIIRPREGKERRLRAARRGGVAAPPSSRRRIQPLGPINTRGRGSRASPDQLSQTNWRAPMALLSRVYIYTHTQGSRPRASNACPGRRAPLFFSPARPGVRRGELVFDWWQRGWDGDFSRACRPIPFGGRYGGWPRGSVGTVGRKISEFRAVVRPRWFLGNYYYWLRAIIHILLCLKCDDNIRDLFTLLYPRSVDVKVSKAALPSISHGANHC